MESKSGRRAILADRIIDCTGDADIAHLAGAEYRVTDKKERKVINDHHDAWISSFRTEWEWPRFWMLQV